MRFKEMKSPKGAGDGPGTAHTLEFATVTVATLEMAVLSKYLSLDGTAWSSLTTRKQSRRCAPHTSPLLISGSSW